MCDTVLVKMCVNFESTRIPSLLKQAWVSSAILLAMVGQGMLFGFPSSLLPALRRPDSPIEVDLSTASWIAGSVGLSGIPGFFLSSIVMVYWGRKLAHGLFITPGIVGWILVFFSRNVTTIICGRILGGFSAGACLSLGAIVLGEYTSPEHRGMFLNLKTTSVCFGGMLVHILGHYFDWRSIALISLVPNILALAINMTWPESPSWLATQRRFKVCEKSFFWLRGRNEKSMRELKDLIHTQKKLMPKEKSSLYDKAVYVLNKFKRKDFLMPLLIIFLGAVLLEVSGRHLFPAYALDIVGRITGEKSNPFYYTLGLDIVITVSAASSSILVKLVKRRALLFVTGFLAMLVLAAACIYLFLVSKGLISPDYPFIPIGLLIVYFILVNLGCTPIPLAFLGEMLPLEHRGAGTASAGIIFCVSLQGGLQMTPFLLHSVDVHGTFTVLGLCSLFCLVILYMTVPETKDKTLQEIEEYFVYGKFLDKGKGNEDDNTKMLESTLESGL